MVEKIKNFITGWWLLGVIVLLQTIVLVLAPNERTLGAGIKPVYLHVSLTWVGMIFLLLSGIVGVILLFVNREGLARWHRYIFLTGIIFYTVGFVISMYASLVNWGGIPYQEPRIRNTINVVVVGIAAWILYELVNNYRVQAAAGILPLIFIFLARGSDRMVLHPDNPVGSAPLGIRATFLIMFGLSILLSLWVFAKLFSGSARSLRKDRLENLESQI